ncbi:PREDICTED: E3 ubiquitin-protein ligase RING1-like [Fragaria vesca subsp. vesca]
MGVPELVQLPIIEQIFKKVVDVAVPKLHIMHMVAILDITYVDSGGLFPAIKPAIRRLERVRLDSLDEATITRTPSCVICLKDLDLQHMVIRLPCSHVCHVDCIVTWLETSHFCPVCRYSMPFDIRDYIDQGASPIISISEGTSSGKGANSSIPEGSGQRANSSTSEGSHDVVCARLEAATENPAIDVI